MAAHFRLLHKVCEFLQLVSCNQELNCIVDELISFLWDAMKQINSCITCGHISQGGKFLNVNSIPTARVLLQYIAFTCIDKG